MEAGRARSQLLRPATQPTARRPLLPPRKRSLTPVFSSTQDATTSTSQNASTPVTHSTVHTSSAAPFASLSRMFVSVQPTTLFRTLAERSALPGPAKLLLFVVALLAAAAAVTRAILSRKVKSCRCCKGYGITRCQVCEGMGQVQWNAKIGHTASCPLCFNRRYVACPDCGGSFPRPIFAHANGPKVAESPAYQGQMAASFG